MDKFIGEGSIVTLVYVEEGEEATYKVVSKKTGEEGEVLADTPMGRALIEYGAEGKTITVRFYSDDKETPFKIKVLKIENAVERQQYVVFGQIQPTPLSEMEQRMQILQTRNIKHLVHFTRLENLQSILTRGIWSRRSLENYADFHYIVNDNERLDNKTYCSCFSVSHCNYKTLFYLKNQYPESKWVILTIDPGILLEEDRALFCSVGNAAKYNGGGIVANAEGLQRIFADEVMYHDNLISRAQLGLQDYEPTNPQAEVLISRKIDPKYIKTVVFETHEDYFAFIQAHGEYKLNQFDCEIDAENEVGNNWFAPRHDYKCWQKVNNGNV